MLLSAWDEDLRTMDTLLKPIDTLPTPEIRFSGAWKAI